MAAARRTSRRSTRSTGRPTAITALAESTHYHKWLFHADAGVGKTVLAGTAPNLLFLTVEAQGTESARVAGSAAHQWVINTAEDFDDATEYFTAGSGCEDYEWVCVDSLSEVEDLEVNRILREGRRKNPRRSLDKMALDDYGVRDARVKRIVDTFNRLPINVIYTTHTMLIDTEDEEGDDAVKRLPLLGSTKNGVLSQKVCGKVTLVGHLTVMRDEAEEGSTQKSRVYRRLYTEAHPGIFAKNRSGLGSHIDNPTIPTLLELVEAAREQRSAGTARRTRRTRRA